MGYIKNIIRKGILTITIFVHREFQNFKNEQRKKSLSTQADIHHTVYISEDAIIQNSQNNTAKIQIGKGSSVYGHLHIFKHDGNIEIGEDCYVGKDTRIWFAKKISIGNRVLIAHCVNIHDNISHPLDLEERHKDYLHIREKGFQDAVDLREEEIIIEDDVWIGFNSIIMKGIKIGKGAIIGAGTIILADVEPYAVVVGNPARVIKYVK